MPKQNRSVVAFDFLSLLCLAKPEIGSASWQWLKEKFSACKGYQCEYYSFPRFANLMLTGVLLNDVGILAQIY